jgi:Ca2+/Na+ antiporter
MYVATALSKIAKYLKLSQTVAGATVIALANGVPDIMTSIVSSLLGDQSEGINELTIGSLMGANIFTYACVFFGVVWVSPNKIVSGLENSNVQYDLIFIISSLIAFMVAATLQLHLMTFGLAMLGFYCIYLYLLIQRSNQIHKPVEQLEEESLLESDEEAGLTSSEESPPNAWTRWIKRIKKDWQSHYGLESLLFIIEFPIKLVLYVSR